jgi:FkbM family methyltransferase
MGWGIQSLLRNCHEYLFKMRCPVLRKWVGSDTTQYGEFQTLWKLAGKKLHGTVVEVGANDGIFCSNSYPFIKRGWKGVLIEPNPLVYADLKTRYEGSESVKLFNLACGSSDGSLPLYMGKAGQTGYATLSSEDSWWYSATRSDRAVVVQVARLEHILEEASCPADFDILSVDTEGFDYEVLRGLNFARYRPKVIMTEDEKPPFTNMREKEDLLASQGYELAGRIVNNAIWRLQD